MFTIITALLEEHARFRAWFDHLEELLPALTRLTDLQRLARETDTALRRHAALEEDLVLLVMDHDPGHRHLCDRFYTEHQEIDVHLTQVAQAAELAQARTLFRRALAASRRHFQREERRLFPFVKRVTEPEILAKLGTIWARRHEVPKWGSVPSLILAAAGAGVVKVRKTSESFGRRRGARQRYAARLSGQ